MISRNVHSSGPGTPYEAPSPQGAAIDRPPTEPPAGEAESAAEADAAAEVLDDIYAAPLPWRATVASTLIALAVLATTR